jgi:hypothetical protein
MTRKYAEDTAVPIARTREHLEALLRRRGCEGFAYGWTGAQDRVEFVWNRRRIRFTLPRPKRDDLALTATGLARSDRAIDIAIANEDRRRWRGLLLVVRAKLEAVEAGITTFESEFLAHIVMPNDQTIGDILVPQLGDGTIAKRLLPAREQPQ